VKILFVLKHPGEVRLLGSVLQLLDERGHRLHLAFQGVKTGESRAALDRLVAEHPGITFEKLPSTGSAGWTYLARSLRLGIDYLRFSDPVFDDATKLRASVEPKVPAPMLRIARGAARLGPSGAGAVRRLLQAMERAILPPPHVTRFVAGHEPDVFVASPLVAVGSIQADYLRAARRLGIRTVYPVQSWDNLTTKGLLRDVPDRVLVWNEEMAAEARNLHAVPADRIRIVGAVPWDHWFGRGPERSRDAFCAEVGLRADRPFVLYVGSSWWVVRDEIDFVRRWVEALRAHGGLLADAGILVRPHPQRSSSEWGAAVLDDSQVAVWPRFGEEPINERARQNFSDSIHHSAAVFGISTSAQIEAAIVGRPVHTLITDEFRGTQVGTVHFRYLEDEESSPLFIARDLAEHAALLERSLRGELPDRNERFVRAFARPHGLEVAATPLYVKAIEELADAPAPAADPGPRGAGLARLLMRPLVPLAVRAARQRREVKPGSPGRDLRLRVRRLVKSGAPVVAGPWTGDRVGELLYWIPFLRWAETSHFGLAERLTVVVPPETRAWYAGLGARLVTAPPADSEAVAIGGDEVAAIRSELAAQGPSFRLQHRLVDFAPLAAPELPAGVELTREFVAVQLEHGSASDLRARLAAHGPVVDLDGSDPEFAAAVLSRARSFVGSWGPSAIVAGLLGVPAVALAGPGEIAPDDLRIARSFLSRPPFACPRVVGPEEAVAVVDTLAPAAPALTRAS
jgi:hypothetical protein